MLLQEWDWDTGPLTRHWCFSIGSKSKFEDLVMEQVEEEPKAVKVRLRCSCVSCMSVVLFCFVTLSCISRLDSIFNIIVMLLQEWNWDTGRSQSTGVFPLGASANLKIYSWRKSKTDRKLSRFVCVVLVYHAHAFFCFVLFCFVSLLCIS